VRLGQTSCNSISPSLATGASGFGRTVSEISPPLAFRRLLRHRVIDRLDFADPDVAEADWIRVELQAERLLLGVGHLFRWVIVSRAADQFIMILYEHPVEQRRDRRRLQDFAVFIETGRGEVDIVRLPFAWLAARVYQRRMLLVDCAALAVEIGRVLVRIENLQ